MFCTVACIEGLSVVEQEKRREVWYMIFVWYVMLCEVVVIERLFVIDQSRGEEVSSVVFVCYMMSY